MPLKIHSGFVVILLIVCSCTSNEEGKHSRVLFELRQDKNAGTISAFGADKTQALLVQNAKQGIRPYIHPIMAPDGKGEVTQYSPSHHKHQTGLYWGLKQVNGRDYFMNWKEDYWRRVSADILTKTGSPVKWQTVYRLLDEKGDSILTETQTWTFSEVDGRFLLDLHWQGRAHAPVVIGEFYVGGLFLRMPWHEGAEGDVVNAIGQRNGEAEGQRAIWNDIGIRVTGRNDMAHFAIMDHPDNKGFPIPWRVDNELGIGPSLQILGDRSIAPGDTEVFHYRLIVYTGERDASAISEWWKEFVCSNL